MTTKQGRRFTARWVCSRVLETTLPLLIFLASINLLLVLMTGGYRIALGPLHISASHVDGPLLLLLPVLMATIWLWRGKQGVSARERLRSPWLLFLGVVFLYSLNGRGLTAGDTIPASYLPVSILREFDLDLDEFPFLYEPEMPWFVQRIDGRVVSAYPPWAGVLSLPVYLLPVLGGLLAQSPWIYDLEKLSATLITALSVVLLLCTLRRLTTETIAYCIATVYALGTSSFSTSSQALWQHGPSQLFITLTMYWLVRGISEPRFSAYAGFALASAVLCRPTNALMAAPIVAYLICHRRDQLIGFLLAALPPALCLAAYNLHYFGSPLTTGFIGTTGPSRIWGSAPLLFSTPFREGLAGVLGSPGRGLFVYSPILIVSVVGMVMVWKDPKPVLLRYLSLAPLPVLMLTAKWLNWWGGGSYGPRLLADVTPLLCLYLYPAFERARSKPVVRYGLVCLAAASIALHALRVFGAGDWNGHPNVDRHPERLWSWTASPPVYFGENLVRDVYAKLQRMSFGLPTSREAPQRLAASYRALDLAPGMTLPPNSFFTCRVEVVNEGEAVWLARAKWEQGEVRLRWRWFLGDRQVPSDAGGWLIGYDVLPGRTYVFTLEIATPRDPGEYILELGLVSLQVTSFEDQGVAPLTLPVRVVHPAL
jgi:Dolichyl-phosphate-mannose-protein mannosyltransferase